MKLICKKYKNCNIKECPHRIPHYYKHNCDINCDDDGIIGNISKCIVPLKELRKEKLKRITNNELHLSSDL